MSDIDIVYLWVNGADPVWQSKHQQAAQNEHNLALYGDVAGRYRDNDELRYNLRALVKFFPEHGHIYIVTDEQTPDWLRLQDGVTVVSHRDLMSTSSLPVFDSGHIESYLHQIPDLSERFIYLNDDVFLGTRFEPDFWFSDDGVALFWDDWVVPEYDEFQPQETALVNASVLSKKWLSARDANYKHTNKIFAHAPRPMFKSVVQALAKAEPELFRAVRQTKFRSWQVPPIVSDFIPRWFLNQGLARILPNQSLYISTGAADAEGQFQTLIEQFGQIAFFCINDTSDDAVVGSPQLNRISAVLAQLLPEPSRFER